MLESVPETTQHAANSFQCSERAKDDDPGLMGWLADAATKTTGGGGPVAVLSQT